jgi:phosphotransferase system enzyme I (PtsI)
MAERARAGEASPGGPVATAEGLVASRGTAVGPLHVERLDAAAEGTVGGEAEERARLEAALAEAKAQLGELMAATDDELAGEVLGFQLALLEDPELVAPGEPAFAEGRGAAAAWRQGIGSLIADYAEADDDYFKARAVDLRDLEQRVLRALAGGGATAGPGGAESGPVVLAVEELTPSRFLELDFARVCGIVSHVGSPSSHVAMLARTRGIPFLVELSVPLDALAARAPGGAPVILDAEQGRLVLDPDPAALDRAKRAAAAAAEQRREAAKLANAPAATADGQAVRVYLNVDDPAALTDLDPGLCDGVGLTRSEFLFSEGPADEETQYAAYKALVAWAQGRPVTVRTLDAGGDKPVPGVTPEGESNPFLGLRGLRLSLARPELFRTQLRALLRAAADGPVKIMLPMVSRPDELTAAREALAACRTELEREGTPIGAAALGIMVETPACALDAAAFEADFYSIGTNDLVQYVMAAARDTASVAYLHDPLNRSVLRLVREVAEAGRARGVEVSVCGEAASLPEVIPALLDRGIRVLSVPPAAIGRTKAAVAAHRVEDADV